MFSKNNVKLEGNFSKFLKIIKFTRLYILESIQKKLGHADCLIQ